MSQAQRKKQPIAVIGAGIQGVCTALSLAERGCHVHLFEEHNRLITEASLWNEGKIHLGFVYGNDPTGNTVKTMIKGSLEFASLLSRWCQVDLTNFSVSQPFMYVVHKDSIKPVRDIEGHFDRVSRLLSQVGARQLHNYFGLKEKSFYRRLSNSELNQYFDSQNVLAAYETVELSVEPRAVASLLEKTILEHPAVEVFTGSRIERIKQTVRSEYRLKCGGVDHHYREVVNATWRDRLRLDHMVGMNPGHPWLFRYKTALHAERLEFPTHDSPPSTTIVLGPFGDIVNFGKGRYYFSWYPTGCLASTDDVVPADPTPGLTEEMLDNVKSEMIEGLSQIVPGVIRGSFDQGDVHLGGGQIFAWGEGDVDQPQSQLHQRYEIGPQSMGQYHSVDTGKYCMAPLFASQLAERICT